MKSKRHRKRLDWRKSVEYHSQPETADEQMLSLLPRRIYGYVATGSAIAGLVQNDVNMEQGFVQRCPKCRHRSLRRIHAEDKRSPDDSDWLCFECGNDCDEFGNKL